MSAYIDRHTASCEIIAIGKRLVQGGYVVANDGNISCLIDTRLVLATPTGVSKGRMTGDMLSVLDLDGQVIIPGSLPVSSEVQMHLRVYRENPDVHAVIHAHPVTATAFAAAGIPLDDSILTEAVTAIGCLPVARFAVPGTSEVPESIGPFCLEYSGALLANHGVILWGEELEQAFFRLEWAEQTAKVTLLTKYIIGQYNTLSAEQVQSLVSIQNKLGIHGGGEPVYVDRANNTKSILPRSGVVPEDSSGRPVPLVDEIVRRVVESIRSMKPQGG